MARTWLMQDETCPNCNGQRGCVNACSNGKIDSGAVDLKGKAIMINCPVCSGTGNCTQCNGKGTVPVRVQSDE